MMLALCLSFIAITVQSGKTCSYIAVDGVAYPTNECFYHQEVDEDNPDDTFLFSWSVSCRGDDDIILRYWTDNDSCEGAPDYTTPDNYCSSAAGELGGQTCQCIGRGSACDTFTFGITNEGAKVCAHEAEERISIVVNECVATGYGSSQRFSCDDTHVIMEAFASTEDCSGEGSYMELDYSSITDDQCVYAQCSTGSTINRKCKRPPADFKPILMGNIQSQHLFVENLRAQHKAMHHAAVDWNKLVYNPVVWAIFAVVVLVITCIVCVIRKRRGEYTKI